MEKNESRDQAREKSHRFRHMITDHWLLPYYEFHHAIPTARAIRNNPAPMAAAPMPRATCSRRARDVLR